MTNQPKNVGTEPNGLHEAIRTLTSNLSLEMVLQHVCLVQLIKGEEFYLLIYILMEDL